ncbi:Dystonin [Eumeta japonica]|uniref:Dystonin n=1 Tax=Eumeta variegata TaxID=151549 RepID=A0A4C1U4B7_EUMVA|nr:Dystonin [Eumeta japonica]
MALFVVFPCFGGGRQNYTRLHVCELVHNQPCCPPQHVNRHVSDLFEDLRDGLNLISLLEVLSGEHLPRERGRMRFHMLQNVQMALDFLRFKKIKLVNIRADDIVDGNPKLTLGLIWTIILHFQVRRKTFISVVSRNVMSRRRSERSDLGELLKENRTRLGFVNLFLEKLRVTRRLGPRSRVNYITEGVGVAGLWCGAARRRWSPEWRHLFAKYHRRCR